ncbi:MAG TPA: galactokinase [Micromonosporaceae bacterium]
MSDTAGLFRERYGREPEVVWAAPGRVNLIGEHTDYNDGFVLPIALSQRVAAAAARRRDARLRLWSAQLGGDPVTVDLDSLRPGSVPGWAGYAAGVAYAMLMAGHRIGGLELVIDGRVPVGAGLSSSAALECAVAAALDELHELGLTRTALALLAQRAENEFVGVPCGVMDQMASLLCEPAHALFLDTRSFAFEQVPVDLAAHRLALLVIDTRASHALVEGAYAERRRTCQRAAHNLGVAALRDVAVDALPAALAALDDDVDRRRVRHVVTENDRVLRTVALLNGATPRDIGPLLTASHTSLRDDFEVSCAELDTAVDAALATGAYGARMTGGGFGGSAITLVHVNNAVAVADAVAAAFAKRGFGRPQITSAVPSAGAHRV